MLKLGVSPESQSSSPGEDRLLVIRIKGRRKSRTVNILICIIGENPIHKEITFMFSNTDPLSLLLGNFAGVRMMIVVIKVVYRFLEGQKCWDVDQRHVEWGFYQFNAWVAEHFSRKQTKSRQSSQYFAGVEIWSIIVLESFLTSCILRSAGF